jgi:hypothetical protein
MAGERKEEIDRKWQWVKKIGNVQKNNFDYDRFKVKKEFPVAQLWSNSYWILLHLICLNFRWTVPLTLLFSEN